MRAAFAPTGIAVAQPAARENYFLEFRARGGGVNWALDSLSSQTKCNTFWCRTPGCAR
jgi:hypothetical protein